MITVTGEDFNGDNGVCLNCGELRYGDTEPDAENYPCEECGTDHVIGMHYALIGGHIDISNEEE